MKEEITIGNLKFVFTDESVKINGGPFGEDIDEYVEFDIADGKYRKSFLGNTVNEVKRFFDSRKWNETKKQLQETYPKYFEQISRMENCFNNQYDIVNAYGESWVSQALRKDYSVYMDDLLTEYEKHKDKPLPKDMINVLNNSTLESLCNTFDKRYPESSYKLKMFLDEWRKKLEIYDEGVKKNEQNHHAMNKQQTEEITIGNLKFVFTDESVKINGGPFGEDIDEYVEFDIADGKYRKSFFGNTVNDVKKFFDSRKWNETKKQLQEIYPKYFEQISRIENCFNNQYDIVNAYGESWVSQALRRDYSVHMDDLLTEYEKHKDKPLPKDMMGLLNNPAFITLREDFKSKYPESYDALNAFLKELCKNYPSQQEQQNKLGGSNWSQQLTTAYNINKQNILE